MTVSITAPIKAISVETFEQALEEFNREVATSAAPGSEWHRLYAFLANRARPLEEFDEEQARRALFVVDADAAGGEFVWWVTRLVASLADGEERRSRLIEALMPDEPVPSTAIVEQARRNAEARARLLAELPTATSAEVAELSGSRARNKAALAGAWRKQGRLFAVSVSGQLRFPVFQLDSNGQPKPVIQRALRPLLAAGLRDWQLALWFAGANARLDGRRPVDVLDSEPERVVEAAEQVGEIPW